jgi:uncharacterized coiled-coil protein SlyX
MTPGWSPETMLTSLERAQEARIAELERRLAEMERLYDKAAADLIEALDVASAYRATASTLHQEVERRNGVERRQHTDFGAALRRIEDARDAGRTNAPERRK